MQLVVQLCAALQVCSPAGTTRNLWASIVGSHTALAWICEENRFQLVHLLGISGHSFLSCYTQEAAIKNAIRKQRDDWFPCATPEAFQIKFLSKLPLVLHDSSSRGRSWSSWRSLGLGFDSVSLAFFGSNTFAKPAHTSNCVKYWIYTAYTKVNTVDWCNITICSKQPFGSFGLSHKPSRRYLYHYHACVHSLLVCVIKRKKTC